MLIATVFASLVMGALIFAHSRDRTESSREACIRELSLISSNIELVKEACSCIDEDGRHVAKRETSS